MSQIIANANAPTLEIKITLDLKYNPPKIDVHASIPDTPPEIINWAVLSVGQSLAGIICARHGYLKPAEAPNLPPAPKPV